MAKHACTFQDWIYRQLCETTTPIHTQLIPLIDAYINSILTPASKANPEATNQPITEQEILIVFQTSAGVSHNTGSISAAPPTVIDSASFQCESH